MRDAKTSSLFPLLIFPVALMGCSHRISTGGSSEQLHDQSAPAAASATSLAESTDEWLREGTWVHSGPKSILGRGTDVIYHFERTDDAWLLHRASIHYPAIGRGEPHASARSTVHAEADGTWLRLRGEAVREAYTYRFDKGALFLGTPVETSPGSWLVGSTSVTTAGEGLTREWRITCMLDPATHKEGPAVFRGRSPRSEYPQTFTVEEEPIYGTERSILFRQASKNGWKDAGRLIWHRDGTVQVVGSIASRHWGAKLTSTDPKSHPLHDLDHWPPLQLRAADDGPIR